MINYTFSEDFENINSDEYIEVYCKQSLRYQDLFHHPEFQLSCISAFSKIMSCYLLSVYNDDKLIGFMTFREEKMIMRKKNYRVLVAGAYMISEYNYPVVNSNHIDDFFKVLAKVLKDHNMYFQNTTAFFKERFLKIVKGSFVKSVIDNPILRNVGDDMFKASKKKGMVRDFKSLSKKHEVIVEHLQTDISEENLDIFFNLHVKRWASVGVDSKFISKQYIEVYKKLTKMEAKDVGSIVFSYLRVDGEIIAAHFGFKSNRRFIYHNVAYDIAHQSKSPGSILLLKILEFSVEENMEIFDMGFGIENYKYRFMNDMETYFDIVFFKSKLNNMYHRMGLKG